MARTKPSARFTPISQAAFAALPGERSTKDYRHCAASGDACLIQFVKVEGRVTHMNYVGGRLAGAVRCEARS